MYLRVALLGCLLLLQGAAAARSIVAEPALARVSVVEGPRQRICNICKEVVNDTATVLSDPDTPKEVIAVMETFVCGQLQGDFRNQCNSLMEIYVPQLIEVLQAQVTPDLICTEATHICKEEEASPLHALAAIQAFLGAEPTTCDSCLSFTAKLLAHLKDAKSQEEVIQVIYKICGLFKGDVKDQCEALADLYSEEVVSSLSQMTPQEICNKVELCPKANLRALTDDRRECTWCRLLVIEARIKLKKPATQAAVVSFLTKSCGKISDNIKVVDQCKSAVVDYAPLFFNKVDEALNDRIICKGIGLCKNAVLRPFDYQSASLIELPTAA